MTDNQQGPDDIAPELLATLIANGYMAPRRLASGEIAAVARFIFTHGLCVGLDETGLRTRFCYPDAGSAFLALVEWDGHGDPPGPWIKEKGYLERSNPARFMGIPIRVESVDE